MNKIIRFIVVDILRNRIVITYGLVLLLFSLSLFSLESRPEKALLSLMSMVLIVVPLVSIVFTTIYYYNSVEFIELVLAQPVDRRRVIWMEYAGIAFSLSLAFLIGVGLPVLAYDRSIRALILLPAGLLVTVVFVSLAFLGAVLFRDKARGIGLALLIWFFFALVFDALLLLVLYSFSDYPLERTVLIMTLLNPIDIARMMIVFRMDAAALMGHSGAVFREFLATGWGWLLSVSVLLAWSALPAWASVRLFNGKDL